MTTKKNSVKNGTKIEKVNASSLNLASVNVSAPAGSGLTAGGAGRASVLSAVGSATHKVRQNSNSQTDNAIIRETWDYAKLKSALCGCFAAPEWSGAAAVRAALAGVPGMTSEMIEGAVLAAARRSGVDLTPPVCRISDVLALIRGRYAAAWSAVVGCSADELTADVCKVYSADGVALSDIDLSGTACQIITDVLSYRYVVAARRAAAWSAAIMMNDAVKGCHSAAIACFAAGLSEDEAVTLAAGRVRAYYAAERERELIRATEKHNALIDVAVLDVLLVDALAAGRYQLADKIRGRRRKALAVAHGRK